MYFLNEGSQINISYRVNSPISSVFLVIAQGTLRNCLVYMFCVFLEVIYACF